MLPKKQKINSVLFNKIFKKGSVFNSDFFYLKIILQKDKEAKSKFTFVVPKKFFKKAVERNLIKRRCFSVLKESNITKGLSGIFFIKKEIKNIKYTRYKEEIEKILKKASFIKK